MTAEIIDIFSYVPRIKPLPDEPAAVILLPVIRVERSPRPRGKIDAEPAVELPCDTE